MLEKWKISPRQFRVLVILCYIGTSILLAPAGLANEAKQDAWISAIVGLIVGLLLVWLYNSVGSLYPNMNLIEYSKEILGKWLGNLVSLLFVFFLFLNCSAMVWFVGNFVTTQIMPETPIQFINLLFVLVIVMGTRLGLETIGRSAEILFPWVIALFLTLIILISPNIDFKNIQPVFEFGLRPILRGSLSYVSYSSLTLITLMLIFPSYINNIKEAKKSFLSGTLIGGIMVFIITILSILVMGYYFTARNTFPVYILAKMIHLGEFLERIESIMASLWIITIFYKTILYFYGAVLGLAQILELKDYRPLTLPLSMILLILSLVVFPNSVYADTWTTTTFIPLILTYGFFLPLLLLIVAVFKDAKRKS